MRRHRARTDVPCRKAGARESARVIWRQVLFRSCVIVDNRGWRRKHTAVLQPRQLRGTDVRPPSISARPMG